MNRFRDILVLLDSLLIIPGLNTCRTAYLSVPSVFAHDYFDINKNTTFYEGLDRARPLSTRLPPPFYPSFPLLPSQSRARFAAHKYPLFNPTFNQSPLLPTPSPHLPLPVRTLINHDMANMIECCRCRYNLRCIIFYMTSWLSLTGNRHLTWF